MSLNHPTASLEVAVYTVHAAEGFAALQRTAHQNLAGIDGFVRSLALRGLDDPSLRADVILWKTAELAQQASDQLPEDSRFSAFLAGLREVRHSAHYVPAEVESLAQIGEAPVIEIAAFRAAQEPMQTLQRTLHDVLPTIPGVVGNLAGRDATSQGQTLDLIAWTSREAFEAAPGALVAARSDLQAFFDSVEETLILELFERER